MTNPNEAEVCAFLSKWIYDESVIATETSRTIEIDLNLHMKDRHSSKRSRRAPVMSGTVDRVYHHLVKFAVVEVNMPDHERATLFVVFKGTSSFMDIASWDFKDADYNGFGVLDGEKEADAAFTTQHLYFMHPSASNNLPSMFLDGLKQRLRDTNAEQLILTGHSLGGMYATACMRLIYRNYVQPSSDVSVDNVIRSTKSITFGAPMVYGTHSPNGFPHDFADFMQDRHTNYIHANDIAPRAWSFNNLDGVIDWAAECAAETGATAIEAAWESQQNQQTHTARDGRMLSPMEVLQAAAGVFATNALKAVAKGKLAAVKQSPSFESYKKVAKCYSHVGNIVVFHEEKIHCGNYLEFDMSGLGPINDHKMERYAEEVIDGANRSLTKSHFRVSGSCPP